MRFRSLPHPSCLVAPVLLVVSVAVPPHIARRGFPSREGDNSRGDPYIPRRFPQLILSAPAHRLIRPTALRPIRASKQAGQDGGHSSTALGSVIASPPRPVIAPSRPSCRTGGANGVSLTSVGAVSGSRFPVSVAWQGMASARPRSHPGKQAGKGGPSPVPPLVSAGGAFLVAPSIGTAGKQAGGSRSVRPPRPLVSAPWLTIDPSG